MSSFLRNLSPSQQVGLLFVMVFGLLIAASIAALVMSLRDDGESEARTQDLRELNTLLNTSWIMCTVFWVGWALGDTVATLLFALVAFLRCANSSPFHPRAMATTAAWCWRFLWCCRRSSGS